MLSVNPDSGGVSPNGTSQGQVSVLNELFVGSQVYEATTLLETGNGSMQLSHFGDGFSVESASSNYMESHARPPPPIKRWVRGGRITSFTRKIYIEKKRRRGSRKKKSWFLLCDLRVIWNKKSTLNYSLLV